MIVQILSAQLLVEPAPASRRRGATSGTVSGMARIPVETLIHINQLLGDFGEANGFYQDVFAAREYMNSYHDVEERDASLFLVGDACIELFSPRTETSLLGRQLNRFGDGWHSFEWKVPDLEQAKSALDEMGIRCGSYYPGGFLMTHPKDSFGVILEMCPHDMANDPRLESGWSSAPWREHPLGIEGLDCIGVAPADPQGAVEFFVNLVGAEQVYEVERPTIKGRDGAEGRRPPHRDPGCHRLGRSRRRLCSCSGIGPSLHPLPRG